MQSSNPGRPPLPRRIFALLTGGMIFCAMAAPNQGVSQDLPDVAQRAYYYDYFFDRNGGLLAYRQNLTANHYFLLRNAKKKEALYSSETLAHQADPAYVKIAAVVSMPHMRNAVRQARHRHLDTAFVDTAFVPILSIDVLSAIRDLILQRERRDPLKTHTDRREYGGYYDTVSGHISIVDSSAAQSPCDGCRTHVNLRDYPYSFHSHPGEQERHGDTTAQFMSPPSWDDEQASSFINYVYSMGENVLYVCSPQGLIATVRFRIFRRHRRHRLPVPMNSHFMANARFSIKGVITPSKSLPTPHS